MAETPGSKPDSDRKAEETSEERTRRVAKADENREKQKLKKTTTTPLKKQKTDPMLDFAISAICMVAILFLLGIIADSIKAMNQQSDVGNGAVFGPLSDKSRTTTAIPTDSPTITPTPVPSREESLEREMIEAVNYQRKLNGLLPLELDPILTKIALFRSDDMAKQNYFSHDPPNGCNAFCMLAFGQYHYDWAGENIAWNNNYPIDETLEAAMAALMDSPEHRDIILDCHYDRIGVGAVKFNKMFYYTQIFEGNIDC